MFLVIDKERATRNTYIMGVGVMRDYNLKLRDLHVSHTLGYVGSGTPKDRDDVKRRGV